MAKATDKHVVLIDATKAAARRSRGKRLTVAELMALRFANASSCEQWVKKEKYNLDELNLIPAPHHDSGYCLIRRDENREAPAAEDKPEAEAATHEPEGEAETTQGTETQDEPPEGPSPTPGLVQGSEVEKAHKKMNGTTARGFEVQEPDCYIALPTPATEDAAKAFAAWYAMRQCTWVEVRRVGSDEVLYSFDKRGSKPPPVNSNDANNRPELPRATTATRRNNNSPWGPIRDKAGELASRPEGVIRSELGELVEKGTPVNWKGLLDQYARKQSKSVRSEKREGEGTRYFIE